MVKLLGLIYLSRRGILILMALVIALTVVQFRFIERRVHY